MRTKPIIGALFALLIASPTAALADDPTESTGPDIDGDGADEEVVTGDDNDVGGPLPESKSDDDPQPAVAAPGTPEGTIVKQAGVGGQVGYGRSGVLELGGSAGFTAAQDFTSVNLTPSVGWFFADNVQISGLLSYTYVDAGDDSGSITTILAEPSYHLPFTRKAFGFLGLGMGASYVSGPGLGFATAPRVGANFLVGRSGILTPSLSYQYTTHDSMETDAGEGDSTVVMAVSSAVMANIGYTVMW
jgi:hypothetical protein